jgi:hypothetical protein
MKLPPETSVDRPSDPEDAQLRQTKAPANDNSPEAFQDALFDEDLPAVTLLSFY